MNTTKARFHQLLLVHRGHEAEDRVQHVVALLLCIGLLFDRVGDQADVEVALAEVDRAQAAERFQQRLADRVTTAISLLLPPGPLIGLEITLDLVRKTR